MGGPITDNGDPPWVGQPSRSMPRGSTRRGDPVSPMTAASSYRMIEIGALAAVRARHLHDHAKHLANIAAAAAFAAMAGAGTSRSSTGRGCC
jgi:hypothetical protein